MNVCDRGHQFSLIHRFPLVDISVVCFIRPGQRLGDVTRWVCCLSKRILVMLAVFTCAVYGKNVFLKESEWFQTVNVFIFAPKSAHFKQVCSVWGILPLVAKLELHVLWTFCLICHWSVQCLYALWVISSPAEMCFSVATFGTAMSKGNTHYSSRA